MRRRAPTPGTRGLVLADTKFEFGAIDGELTLIDEVLLARLVALLGPRRVRGRPAARRSTSSSCATGWTQRLEPRAAGAGAAAPTWSRARRSATSKPSAVSPGRLDDVQARSRRRRRRRPAWRAGRVRHCCRCPTRPARPSSRALLAERGTSIVASGGTAAHLKQSGVPVTAVEEWTGFARDAGRAREDAASARARARSSRARGSRKTSRALEARGLEPIDLVAVTLYPFEERGRALDDAGMIEEIDIGGVALLRAAPPRTTTA